MIITRSLRRYPARFIALVLAFPACSGGTTETRPTVPMTAGADISSLKRIEQAGGVFRANGQSQDAIAIMRGAGASVFRLRLFVNPNDSDVVVNDLAYTTALAVRVKASGAKLLLDIHYSDTWADPGHQATPAAWAALPIDSLLARVRSYTANVIATLKAAGARPDIVQVGNEIDAGMLWPLGQLTGTGDTTAEWNRFTSLLNAAIQGVRDSLGPSDTVRIMLHYSQGGNAGATQWFFDHVVSHGVGFDLIGLSYYPWWHGTLGALTANIEAMGPRYGKDIWVVETAYPWRAGGWEGMAPSVQAMTWAISPDGQRQFLDDVARTVPHGSGVLWWYPESIQVPGLFAWGGGSLALFDAGGNALPAMTIFGGADGPPPIGVAPAADLLHRNGPRTSP